MSPVRLTAGRVVLLGLLLLSTCCLGRLIGASVADVRLPATLGLLCCMLVLVGIVE